MYTLQFHAKDYGLYGLWMWSATWELESPVPGQLRRHAWISIYGMDYNMYIRGVRGYQWWNVRLRNLLQEPGRTAVCNIVPKLHQNMNLSEYNLDFYIFYSWWWWSWSNGGAFVIDMSQLSYKSLLSLLHVFQYKHSWHYNTLKSIHLPWHKFISNSHQWLMNMYTNLNLDDIKMSIQTTTYDKNSENKNKTMNT